MVAMRWPILGTAIMVGSVSFAIGFIGPLLFSDSNLGPLLGIFITGPLGLLAGVLAGIILSARQQGQPTLKRELQWLAGAWAGALFFTWASTLVGIGWVAIGAQLAVVSCAGSLFYGFSAKLPACARRSRPFILIGAALTILSSIYPPLDPASVGDARYAFFLDPRFDASKNVPEYKVYPSMLFVHWLVILAVVACAIFVERMSNRHDPT